MATLATFDLMMRDDPAGAARRVAEALEEYPVDSMDPLDAPFQTLAVFYARAGQVERARSMLAGFDAALTIEMRGARFPARHMALGLVATAEGRLDDAIDELRQAAEQSAGDPVYALPDLARAYDLAGNPDSAVAVFARFLTAPSIARADDDRLHLASSLKRLGELYEEQGDRDNAIQYYNRFVELWDNADPELQPQVADVRGRIARLVGEGR